MREYSFKRAEADDRTFWVRFGHGAATYAGVRTRLALQKRAKLGGGVRDGGATEAFAHPSHVRLKRRAPAPAEAAETAKRSRELLGEEEEEEEDGGME